jgi:hypothetical protein
MTNQKKLELQNQYHDMWDTDWTEIIGSTVAAFALAIFMVLWFIIL